MKSKRNSNRKEPLEKIAPPGIDLGNFDLQEFQRELTVDLDHDSRDPSLLGKIAWEHIEAPKELPDAYTRLDKLETGAGKFWTKPRRG